LAHQIRFHRTPSKDLRQREGRKDQKKDTTDLVQTMQRDAPEQLPSDHDPECRGGRERQGGPDPDRNGGRVPAMPATASWVLSPISARKIRPKVVAAAVSPPKTDAEAN
jgi:hypothetical protein